MKQNITIYINKIPLRFTIDPSEEQIYREAANAVNQTYESMKSRFQTIRNDDLWMYVALQMATNWRRETNNNQLQPIVEKLKELDNKIVQHLDEGSVI